MTSLCLVHIVFGEIFHVLNYAEEKNFHFEIMHILDSFIAKLSLNICSIFLCIVMLSLNDNKWSLVWSRGSYLPFTVHFIHEYLSSYFYCERNHVWTSFLLPLLTHFLWSFFFIFSQSLCKWNLKMSSSVLLQCSKINFHYYA